MDNVTIMLTALRFITSYVNGSVNRTWIRAFHTPLIQIALEALVKVALCDAAQARRTSESGKARRLYLPLIFDQA
jgi:hypothetical protein